MEWHKCSGNNCETRSKSLAAFSCWKKRYCGSYSDKNVFQVASKHNCCRDLSCKHNLPRRYCLRSLSANGGSDCSILRNSSIQKLISKSPGDDSLHVIATNDSFTLSKYFKSDFNTSMNDVQPVLPADLVNDKSFLSSVETNAICDDIRSSRIRSRRRLKRCESDVSSESLTSRVSEYTTRNRSRSTSVTIKDRSYKPKSGVSLSLCGCGFLSTYHFGVASCLMKHGHTFLSHLDRVAGSSTGAVVAALLVTAPSIQKMLTSTQLTIQLTKCVRRKPLRALSPGNKLEVDLFNLLDNILPRDAHHVASGKLHVSLSNVKTKKNEIFSVFNTRRELIDDYCGGALSDNLPTFRDGRTVTVSPFSGRQDISPRDSIFSSGKAFFVNVHNHDMQLNMNNVRRLSHAFFPPRSAIMQQYYELGHKDASLFLLREGLYEIPRPSDNIYLVYESSV